METVEAANVTARQEDVAAARRRDKHTFSN